MIVKATFWFWCRLWTEEDGELCVGAVPADDGAAALRSASDTNRRVSTNLVGDFESFQQSHKLLFEVRLLTTEKNRQTEEK